MIGIYDNFPVTIHNTEQYTSKVPIKQIQQKLIKILYELNQCEFTFEQVSIPTIPQGRLFFEFGIAEATNFTFINEEVMRKTLKNLAKEPKILDLFCAIRYYKMEGEKKRALKFDYYIIRMIFDKSTFEVQTFHERGPRYLLPQEVFTFVVTKINESIGKKILIKQETD
ncbi:MAG: hypothetical protein PHY74_03170 [Candidatus Bathyarchaeota archaeon]|nr:hypothetical protein [Candidatus Bathyarchaeota archaeon]MDD4325743.1 hypothetical protein [Candidatus Bathyarchaeota archaeon]MDI9579018.1 hypothetical protein [Thermoproteota archaeon]MDT8781855.1 hypothetical protein [Candidatus Bathyarchaeota archaeon]NLD65101.1 hypothetical protein [Thermoproteota archaeon]